MVVLCHGEIVEGFEDSEGALMMVLEELSGDDSDVSTSESGTLVRTWLWWSNFSMG